jgi:hypothetical protein
MIDQIDRIDKIEKEFNTYDRSINDSYILRKRDKCIINSIFIVSISLFVYNLYLIFSFFYIKK